MKQFEIEINGIKESIDLTDKLIKELDLLESKIKDLGNANIDFNIEDLRKQIKDSNTEWESVSKKLKEITNLINTLEKKKLDSNNVDKYNNSLGKLENAARNAVNEQSKLNGIKDYNTDKAVQNVDKLTNSLEKAVRAEDLLGTKITVNVAGMSLQFDDVNQAVGVLEDKLYQLSTTGQKDTAVFKEITLEIANLKLNVNLVDAAVDNAFSGGLSKIVGGVLGIAGIASVGVGLNLLFGFDNKELNDSILKFTALTLVMLGAVTVLQEMAKQGTILGNILRSLNGVLNIFGKGLTAIFNIGTGGWFAKLSNNFNALIKTTEIFGDKLKYNLKDSLEEAFNFNTGAIDTINDSINRVFNDLLTKIPESFQNIKSELAEQFLSGNVVLDTSNMQIPPEVLKDIEKYNAFAKQLSEGAKQNTKDLLLLSKAFINLDGNLTKTGKAVLILGTWFGKMPAVLKTFATGVRLVAGSLKALSKSLLVIYIVLEVVELLSKAIEALGKWIKTLSGDNMIDRLKETENALKATDKSLLSYINDLNLLESTGVISASTKITKSIEATNKALLDVLDTMRALSEEQGKSLAFESSTWFNTKDLDNIKDLNKYFNVLAKAVEANTDEMQQLKKESKEVLDALGGVNWVKEVWYTASDAVSDFRTLEKRYILDLLNDINRIDFSKPSKEVDKFYNKLHSKEYQRAIGDITLVFDEQLAELLSKRFEQIDTYLTNIKKLNDDLLIEDRKTQDAITNNNIAAIKNRFQRERAELNQQRKLELRDAGDNEVLKQSIVNKYNAKERELLRKQGNEIRNIQNQINNNRLESLEDGLQKQLAKLEQQRKQELDNARDSEILVGNQVLAINQKYDKLVLEAKRTFYKNREKLLDDYKEKYRQVLNEIANMEYEFVDKKIQLSTDPTNIKDLLNYYKELRDLQNEQAKRQKDILINKEDYTYEQNVKEEEKRNKELLQSLEDNYKKGLLTKKDYDKLVEDEMQLHYLKLDLLTKQKEQNITSILLDELKTRQNNNSAYLQKQLTNLQDYYNKVQQPKEDTKPASRRQWTEYIELLEGVKSKAKETSDEIDKAFESGEISFPEFEQAKKQIDLFNKEVEDKEKDAKKQRENALQSQISKYTQDIMQYANVANTMWSMFNDMWQSLLEQEENRLLEEYDALEEAYNKQEELTQKHADKLNDIEDELKTSRGDRRAHLIEQLNAERAALLENEAEEQRIEKDKEKIQKQLEQLEKKKRKLEKANNIASAIMSTLTGAANALAVKPPTAGIILAGVVTAMGMARVAQIKGMKYAKGGLLTGPSHEQGGIPVGNTGIEVEGNEYIVNKVATKQNLPLLEYINKTNKKVIFEDGGLLPNISLPNDKGVYLNDDRPVVVQVVDIVNKVDNYKKVQVMAGLK